MPRYVRAYVPGGIYFFTLALRDRRRPLLTEHVHALGKAFRRVRQRWPYRMDAVVVLPDHLHCVWTLPDGDADCSTRWRLIKAAFARQISRAEDLTRRRDNKRERGIWQRRFWEHLIRDEADLAAHIDYIHYNPVKHGLVKHPGDWRWSSFHRFVAEGVYPGDWAAPPRVRELELE